MHEGTTHTDKSKHIFIYIYIYAVPVGALERSCRGGVGLLCVEVQALLGARKIIYIYIYVYIYIY